MNCTKTSVNRKNRSDWIILSKEQKHELMDKITKFCKTNKLSINKFSLISGLSGQFATQFKNNIKHNTNNEYTLLKQTYTAINETLSLSFSEVKKKIELLPTVRLTRFFKTHNKKQNMNFIILSNHLGISSSSFSQYLTGRSCMDENTIKKVSSILKLTKEENEYFLDILKDIPISQKRFISKKEINKAVSLYFTLIKQMKTSDTLCIKDAKGNIKNIEFKI